MANDFSTRLAERVDELRWLYMELYDNGSMFAELCEQMYRFSQERAEALKELDAKREADPEWYKKNDMLGMMFYIDNFAGNLQGVRSKVDYLQDTGVNYIHLMPFLDTVDGRSDGGYAVADFRKVKSNLGTMEDLEELTVDCHKKGISICMDFVMNHTSEDHEWAKKAKEGDGEYMSRYFFYDNFDIPSQYERTVPQVFPTTAPGNFTWCPQNNCWVLTSFYPYQWDLNYRNPRVFNEMMYNFLFLANKGIDVFRIDAVPYIWKELGTDCRNLPRVHTIVRMMRIIGEVVCPGTILLGEVVMEPAKVVPYFGTVEKPECHMLYNVTTMATIWNTVATRNTMLLKKQLDTVYALPKQYVFLNYLRCHDDIGWGLDYATLRQRGINEVIHKNYLNHYFLGIDGYSHSRGALYNYDPVSQDGRFCGTTASLCGIEAARKYKDGNLAEAIDQDIMLHAFMLMQSGIPILYSGDEIGQENDDSYLNDPNKRDDSRYIHRGKMNWDLEKNIHVAGTIQQQVYDRLKQLTDLRKKEKVFMADADTWTVETTVEYNEVLNNKVHADATLCIGRYYDGDKVYGIFNFSEHHAVAFINENDGDYRDLIDGSIVKAKNVELKPYEFKLLKKI